MDIWEIFKLVGRRWYLGVPMLVLTIVATGWALTTIKPDYSSEGTIILVPPADKTPLTNSELTSTNTWVELGEDVMAHEPDDVHEVAPRLGALALVALTLRREQPQRTLVVDRDRVRPRVGGVHRPAGRRHSIGRGRGGTACTVGSPKRREGTGRAPALQ